MDAFSLVSLGLIAFGLAIRISTTRRFLELYRERYKEFVPRSWMFKRLDDPEVEKARLRPVVGNLLVLAGTLVILVRIILQGPKP